MNRNTEQARVRWAKALATAGLPTYEAVWEGSDVLDGHKGLDDLLAAGIRPRIRRVTVTPPEISKRRIPRPTAMPGSVDVGTSLEAARDLARSSIRSFLRYQALPSSRPKALEVRTSPGTGKSTATGDALAGGKIAARIVVGTKELAAEQARIFGYGLIEGRNQENCRRIDVVQALAADGHPIQALACGTEFQPRCPYRLGCPYWAQFDRPGPLVGTAEQLYNPTFLRPGTEVIVDDADLARAMVERREITPEMLRRAVEGNWTDDVSESVHRLLRVLQQALIDAPTYPALQGPRVWDHLTRVARQRREDLMALIRNVPDRFMFPTPEDDVTTGVVTVDTVEAAIPATIGRLLGVLREEVPMFSENEDFTCCLRLSTRGIEMAWLKEPATETSGPQDGKVFLDELPILLIDATPIDFLVDRLLANHVRLPVVDATVTLPDAVEVVQCGARTNGHLVLREEPLVASLMTEIAGLRQRFPVSSPADEAVIAFKDHKAGLVEAGFASEQVRSFGSSRGTNVLATVQRLHVAGRPMPPATEITYLAQVIHHGEAPVSDAVMLTARPYGGQPWEVDVVDFEDARPAELLRAYREDELTQVLHRARLTAVGTAGDPRKRAQVILHTSHPVPGLRVDELQVGAIRADLNMRRADEAAERIRKAEAEIRAEGTEPTQAEVARRAGACRETVGKYFGKGVGTPQKESLRGVDTFPKTEMPVGHPSQPPNITGPRAERVFDKDALEPCPGGCGTMVPMDQKCRPCAERGVEEWVARRKPRELPRFVDTRGIYAAPAEAPPATNVNKEPALIPPPSQPSLEGDDNEGVLEEFDEAFDVYREWEERRQEPNRPDLWDDPPRDDDWAVWDDTG